MKRRLSKLFVIAGIILLIGAASLTGYNCWDAERAYRAAEAVEEKLNTQIPEQGEDELLETFLANEKKDMPTITIEGKRYIGVLKVPDAGLKLPVMDECDLSNLRIAPCLYAGSIYQNNMVIAGHNYAKHFSPVKRLTVDAEVIFEDVLGNEFRYRVLSKEIIQPTDIEGMISNGENDWDLTLFTCTPGGQARCAVRCGLEQ